MLSRLRRMLRSPAPGQQRTTYRDRYLLAGLLSWLHLPLPRILALFGSDKQAPGQHSYGATYAACLRHLRYRPARILEIGLLGGASLLAWRCYFPRATTIGIDIEPKQQMAGSRTRIYTGDQGSADDLAALATSEGPFDLIIDDGSHLNAHQIFTFQQMFDSLKDGGIYVIEDVQTSFWPETVGTIAYDGRHIGDPLFGQTCYGAFLELAKYLNHAEFLTREDTDATLLALGRRITRIAFEHNLILIWKGDNTQRSNLVTRDQPAG